MSSGDDDTGGAGPEDRARDCVLDVCGLRVLCMVKLEIFIPTCPLLVLKINVPYSSSVYLA